MAEIPEHSKNPFKAETPEWQMWELAQSAYSNARAYSADAERSRAKSQEQRTKGDAFVAALDKIKASGCGPVYEVDRRGNRVSE